MAILWKQTPAESSRSSKLRLALGVLGVIVVLVVTGAIIAGVVLPIASKTSVAPVAAITGAVGNLPSPPSATAIQAQGTPTTVQASPTSGAIAVPSLQEKMIKTARMNMEVDDVPRAFHRVASLAEEAGGYVLTSSVKAAVGYTTASLEIRVPAASFTSTLERVRGLGKIRTEEVRAEDVTGETIDLQSRLRVLQRKEEKVNPLLDSATTLGEIGRVERELEPIQNEIEKAKGRLAFLRNRVEMSTLHVELAEGKAPPPTPEPVRDPYGLRETVTIATGGALLIVKGIIVLLGYVIPLAILYVIGRRMYQKWAPRLWPQRI